MTASPSLDDGLTGKELHAFHVIIRESIVARYDGSLERDTDANDGGFVYTPLDEDLIRSLLVTLWEDLLSPQEIDTAYDHIITYGADKWPKAWCQEDVDDEEEMRLSLLDQEEAQREALADSWLPDPPQTPSDDLRVLRELGYASKDPAVRDAAGRVDTWVSKLPFYLDMVRQYKKHAGDES
jgi:hypothetical protein